MRRILALLVLVAALGAVALGYFLMTPVAPRGETFVEIAPGTGSRAIGAELEARGVVRSRYVFDAWRLIRGGRLKAGEYRFEARATVPEVYDRILRGDIYYHTLTIPEGYNLFDVAQAVESAGLGRKDTFLAAETSDVGLISDLDPGAKTLEGYLFPDTYHFPRTATPKQILAAMVNRFRKEAASLGLTEDVPRTVTLASLVEKETPVAADRPLVASVFVNRLAKGMPLMTDPTVIYAAKLDHRYRGTIYRSDLDAESAYNTYRHAGLPPGPICNPGLASLRAAMHPAETDYLYFVADPGAAGHSRFASTLAEHNRNVDAYRQAQRAAQTAH